MNRDLFRKAFPFFFIIFSTFIFSISNSFSQDEEHEHAHVFTPEEEAQFYFEANQKGDFGILEFRFEQTSWRECTDFVTGNYTGYNCANRRGISSILKTFMDDHMPKCVQKGLDAIGEGQLDQLHIIHDGILGDRRHSPKSMHAENRAIDIRAFKITTYDSRELNLRFNDRNNRDFYNAFRQCWGETIQSENGCPLYNGVVGRTGSIGWEDRNHQNHMHTSVPYCVNGQYGSYYYRR